MMFDVPDGALEILQTLQDNKFEAYLVGGCVRDLIMDRNPHDWDITTSALPEEVEKLFNKTIPTGIKHGTVTVVLPDGQYEVTTFRIDGNYSDGRRPDSVSFTTNLIQDLSRRDFTINAIAYNPITRGYIDPFDGKRDIKDQVIKCVGDPNERFQEDGLRILRAIRFSAQLNFYIRLNTVEAMKNNIKMLERVSKERINSELTKILLSDNPSNVMNYPEILCCIIPEFKITVGYNQNSIWHNRDLYDHMKCALEATGFFDSKKDLSIRLAAMLHDISKPQCMTIGEDGHSHFNGHGPICAETATSILKLLRYDNKTISEVNELIFYHDVRLNDDKKTIRRWINKIGYEQLMRLFTLRRCDLIAQEPDFFQDREEKLLRLMDIAEEVYMEKPCMQLIDLEINGNDLKELGVPEGKQIGVILNYLLDKVLENPSLNDKHRLIMLALLKKDHLV